MAINFKLKPRSGGPSISSRTYQATLARNKRFELAVLAMRPSFIEAKAAGIHDLDDLVSFLVLKNIEPFKAQAWTARGVWRCIQCLRRLGADPGGWTPPRKYSTWKKEALTKRAVQIATNRNVEER